MSDVRLGGAAECPDSLAHVVDLLKGWVDRLGWIWVEAQVIELRRRAAPTQFLTLRDAGRNISASVTCSRAVLDAAGPLTEGTTVTARLKPRVWADRASLSFECSEIRISGEGRLLAMLEELKRKLQAEGLFDSLRKKRLPYLPRGIGLITGADSAAERDVLTNVWLRWESANILVRHTLVQGPSAAAEVMDALAAFDADERVDVIVIARGGGSLEDLLPFSDEGLVRAVAAARTPVVSAIGHEPDTPILDLVADLRASTPTDAAKRIVPDVAEERAGLEYALERLRGAVTARVAAEQASLDQLRSRPVLANPLAGFEVHFERMAALRDRLRSAAARAVADEQSAVTHTLAQVRAMSPMATLERGYAIVTSGDATSVTSVGDVRPGDAIGIYVADGEITANVKGTVAHHGKG
ncbi:MAG: exodeoxyribonuclease VII large subunit [Propionibacteriaceae bacterium]|jgi:exodeoxyribonuclease VII large subunit|nr:exodeoxyribonuclease VII large subunit [Propionibacteriaceae bacterium]